MSKFGGKYRSQSHRWQFWDYSAPGAYYITSVTKDRINRFGKFQNKEITLSKEGIILDNMFKQISGWNNQIIVDKYVIMPNHFHCILIITDNDFEYPVEPNPIDNEFWLGGYVDTIDTELIIFNGGIERKRFMNPIAIGCIYAVTNNQNRLIKYTDIQIILHKNK